MELNKKTKYFNWEMWGTAAFLSFCVSTIFIIFFSTSAVKIWPQPWNRISILAACFIPMTLVLVWKIPEWIQFKELKKELFFIPAIVILGILNIIFSESRSITLKVMTLFLVTGIGIFGVANCVMCSKFRQEVFLWICWACLMVLCIYGIQERISNNSVLLFSYNPIPAGSLLILLFIGPLLLFPSSSGWLRLLHLLSIILGIVVIILIGKRGPVLGLLGMAFLPVFILQKKKLAWAVLLIAIILFGAGYKVRNYLPSTLTKSLVGIPSFDYRLKNFPLAGHIFLKKPFFGVGLRAPIIEYLNDYQPKSKRNQRYLNYIKRHKTLENIILCSFVSMGGLFTISYIALIAYLLISLLRYVKHNPVKQLKMVMLLLPLFGFFIHSMTFDSLLFPHLNWLFHTYLGLMANFNEI